jgi:uncharacterized protein YaaN involved in tellurite resistance
MSNETVTYSLEAVLKEIKDSIKEVSQKVDTLHQSVNERLTKLEIGQAELKGDIKALTEKVEGMDKRLENVEGTQKNQVWTLIILLSGAIATASWRAFFSGNP